MNMIQKLKKMKTNNFGTNIWAKTNFIKKITHKEVIQVRNIIQHLTKIHRSLMYSKTNKKRDKPVHNNLFIKRIILLTKSMINLLLFLRLILLTNLHNRLEKLTMITNLMEIHQDHNHAWEVTLVVFHHLGIQLVNSKKMMDKKCQIQ